ncbi:MAG: carbamoyltransferase HypF, partial [Acidobacteriota bacterium]
VKGIGGYHLVCDALNADAVERLRQRKYREDKPFALMAATVDVIRRYCDVSDAEADILRSRERPIVLLTKKENANIPESIAPGVATLGFMLPYTPLHYLLFDNLNGPLVMTSGNISDEPICYEDDEADTRLNKITDYFLTNNRRIHIRTDDSIVRVYCDAETERRGDAEKRQNPCVEVSRRHRVAVLRRSRGYAPAPIKTSFKFKKQILACGAELKNTFCLAKDNYAFLSHHIGDLENLETFRSFTDGIAHFARLFDLEPEVIAYDLHPEYLSTKYAYSCDRVEIKIGVQHHHAHIASCLADNGIEGEVIGVAMDGLGYGTDGKIWGGEFFIADFEHAERIAHLNYVPMPGGAKAIREPWRMAAVYLQKTFGDEVLDLNIPFSDKLDREKWSTISSMIASRTNCPETSSMGRLFDAISGLLCLRNRVNYEGQAAIALETVADKTVTRSYEFTIAAGGVIKSEELIRQAVGDLIDGVSAAEVSARFHMAVANLITNVATNIREKCNINRVALSGGVFQNMFLLKTARASLNERGFEVLTHRRVPTNDGGISLGQAAIANAKIRSGRI